MHVSAKDHMTLKKGWMADENLVPSMHVYE